MHQFISAGPTYGEVAKCVIIKLKIYVTEGRTRDALYANFLM